MYIETLEVCGFRPAIEAMRHPYKSYDKSDSAVADEYDSVLIGPNDKDLSMRLQKAGPEHCKHLRMIMVWAKIKCPRYWWQEMDTYRNGVEKLSTSTMHKLLSRPLTLEDFEPVVDGVRPIELRDIITNINRYIEHYKTCEDEVQKKQIWRTVVNLLPQSYLQERTVMMSYAALRNIVRQRKGHRLIEWANFIDWAKTLPNSWMIFDEEETDETA